MFFCCCFVFIFIAKALFIFVTMLLLLVFTFIIPFISVYVGVNGKHTSSCTIIVSHPTWMTFWEIAPLAKGNHPCQISAKWKKEAVFYRQLKFLHGWEGRSRHLALQEDRRCYRVGTGKHLVATKDKSCHALHSTDHEGRQYYTKGKWRLCLQNGRQSWTWSLHLAFQEDMQQALG